MGRLAKRGSAWRGRRRLLRDRELPEGVRRGGGAAVALDLAEYRGAVDQVSGLADPVEDDAVARAAEGNGSVAVDIDATDHGGRAVERHDIASAGTRLLGAGVAALRIHGVDHTVEGPVAGDLDRPVDQHQEAGVT